jgi:hypothetical protein
MLTYEERVSNGVALLDERRPLWFLKIDELQFDLQCADLCVLGFAYGKEESEVSGYDIGVNELGLSHKQAIECGFTLSVDTLFSKYEPFLAGNWNSVLEYEKGRVDEYIADYKELENVWREVIKQKKEEYAQSQSVEMELVGV